ncbi:unnamed protein product [Phaedon cochleariae]|uniref:Ig-like domain-containing protein n=1 Tax=Phaedon cochleariae TaxID=80249 RepID=A0A9P0DSZ9_PHACE|nr:unnamed protein product [Phaedon cochleariae]
MLIGAVSLHLVDVRIPTHAVRHQSARLECHYDLDGETLYSVKWYKDGHEFYRFMQNSTENVVILSSVQLSSTGIYRCEVSGEAPFFETVTDHQRMTVVALPDEGPKITGGRARYQVGDTVHVNCTSGRSKPAAQLSWMINGQPADAAYLRGPRTVVLGREGLESSTLGLEFVAGHEHFKRGNMKLKCLATIATLYLVSNEESVEGERPQRASVMESRGTAAPSGSRADRVHASSSNESHNPCVACFTVCYLSLLLSTA